MRFSVSDPFPLFGLWDLSLPHHSCKLDSSCAAHVLLFSFCSFPSRNYHMSFLWFPNQRREGGKERKKGDGVTENRGGQMMSASHPCSFTDLKHFNLIWKAVGHLTGWFSQWCSCHSLLKPSRAGAEWKLTSLSGLKMTSCRELAMLCSMLYSSMLFRFFHFPEHLRLLIYLDFQLQILTKLSDKTLALKIL